MSQKDRDEKRIQSSFQKAVNQYINSRLEKVPEFVSKHFSLRGALRLHKKAIGADLIKGPLNISWSLIYTILRGSGAVLHKFGEKKISRLLREKLPPGFETRVQKEIVWLIYTELLELPFQQGRRESKKDALLEIFFSQKAVAEMMTQALKPLKSKADDPNVRKALEKNLREYSTSRTAAADLAGTLITLSLGAAAFKKMTPGAMAAGSSLAAAIAQHAAVSNFFLGSTLGSVYYSIFPVSASLGLIAATTGSIMAAMAIVTSFAGIITDPLQAKLGIHQRRLRKFILMLKPILQGKSESKYEIRDRYVARVFDMLDVIKTVTMNLT
ncbi:MAG: hypothetical protein GXO74_13800 [Calditrichaeota bacterium]|nr:hypothetical protein [Calditrichota bacterium]